ncbi:MAG: glutamyl-tRNA reductase [Candidatus Melainabacteria bacterium GWF2_32_7]|nr:MAG: glutamyl-tRNA reductase [Candidatus Melainabacteria bacterium GWF2_32_7]
MTGVDHKRCPIEIREKVSFTHINIDAAYAKLKQDNTIQEAVILSTCNRSEIYAVVDNVEKGKDYLKNFYAAFFNVNCQEIEDYIEVRSRDNVVRHIFEVACGFQSLVLGEDQILGQVKDSYNTALKNEATGKFLNRLFIDSITSAKKIKTMTGISENQISVSSIGVKLIDQKLNGISGKSALVIGLGEMSRIAVQNMLDRQIGKIFVTNRTRRKVTDFAKEFSGIIEIDFKDRYEVMGDVDIIVSCTSAPHFIVTKEIFSQYYRNQPICILDLAIPRDVEPDIQEMPGVELYRIDDLEKIAQENIEKRLSAKEKGEKILNHDIRKYINWVEEAKLIDIIVSIQNNSQEIMSKELQELRKKLDGIDEKQMQIIEKAFYSFAKSFTHQPMVKLKEFVKESPKYDNSDILEIEEDK